MINSINIQNFQSHTNTTLELNAGVNAIVGPSDCGKSAVFRALNWLINNRPGGLEFHRWMGGDPSVVLNLDDATITRTRWGNENIYKLDDQEFKAFGTTVPEPIQDVLNISDINFQFQLDDPFMFGQTPGNIARKLNEVVDLAVIDKALFNINQRYRQEVNQLKNAEDKKKLLSDELSEYDWLPDAENHLTGLEQLDKSIINNKQQALALEIVIKEIGHIELEIDQVSTGPIKAEGEILKLIDLDNQIDKNFEDSETLDDLISEIEGLKEEVEKAQGCLQFEAGVQEANDLNRSLGMRWVDRNNFMRFLDDIKKVQDEFDYKKEIIEQRTKKSTLSYLKELRNFIKSKVTQKVINQDLNFLLPYKRFNSIRKTLKTETLMLLEDEIKRISKKTI